MHFRKSILILLLALLTIYNYTFQIKFCLRPWYYLSWCLSTWRIKEYCAYIKIEQGQCIYNVLAVATLYNFYCIYMYTVAVEKNYAGKSLHHCKLIEPQSRYREQSHLNFLQFKTTSWRLLCCCCCGCTYSVIVYIHVHGTFPSSQQAHVHVDICIAKGDFLSYFLWSVNNREHIIQIWKASFDFGIYNSNSLKMDFWVSRNSQAFTLYYYYSNGESPHLTFAGIYNFSKVLWTL